MIEKLENECIRYSFLRGVLRVIFNLYISDSSFQGFSRLRMHNKGGSPVAFVEFQVSLFKQ